MPDLSGYTASPNTGESLSTQAPDSVRALWDMGVEVFEQNFDFFKQFEGPSKTSAIQSRTDTSKGRGQKVYFTNMAGMHHEPHMGGELFESGEHFEEARIGSDSVTVDWWRHATRFTERGEEVMGMRGELDDELPERLGEWLGRLKTEHALQMFKYKGDAAYNYRFANNRASMAKLLPTDTLDYESIIQFSAQMQRSNGQPAMVGTDDSGNQIYKYLTVATSDALFSLDMDPKYQNAKENSGVRGKENLIFSGGFHNLRGNVIKEYTVVDHDGVGPIGSPMNPKAELGAEITAGTATFTIKGGGSAEVADLARVLYFKYFPNYQYKFAVGDTLAAASTPFYVAVINTSGDDLGKFGFYECVGNTGAGLTVTKRLHSVDGAGGADIRFDQVGNVVWDAAVNTNAHPEGSLILLCSENGAAIGSSLFMGACAARRGYGKYQRRRVTDDHEGGFVRDVFIQSVFGQAPRRDVRGRCPGFLWLTHAVQYPGITLEPTLAE